MAINPQSLSAAQRMVTQAAGRYLSNPRVSTVDFGFRIRDRQGFRLSDEPCLRIHLRDKPRGTRLELLEARRPDLYIDDRELRALEQTYGFSVDLPLGDYRLDHAVAFAPAPSGAGGATASHIRRFDPIQGGISVGNAWLPGSGTLGGKVVDRRTGDQMLLSNWHVLAGRWWIGAGTSVCQPGRLDGGDAGHLVARLTRDAWRSFLDAAVATLVAGSRPLINDQLGIGPVQGSATPRPLMHVTKSGRTTRVTSGVVTSILPGRMLTYTDGVRRVVRDIWAIEPEVGGDRISAAGDSGSWWVDVDSRRAVGLHFAGEQAISRALAMGMPAVLDALAVDVALT